MGWMGGRYPTSQSPFPNQSTWPPGQPEHNFGFKNISRNTSDTLSNWPPSVPITFLGWEVGSIILTGAGLTNSTPPANPCRRAFIDHQGPSTPRSSWDPATTLFAVRGAEAFYDLHDNGHNVVNGTDGTNVWMPGTKGNQAYLIRRPNVSPNE